MLERTTRPYFEDLADDLNYLQSNIVNSEKKKPLKRNKKLNSDLTQRSDDFLVEEHTMTRKTRTRRPRISALQSGYCAVCNIPYNSVEDHIQSKKHQKLIGEDANYIALNGSLNGFLQTNSIPFLNLNGIDAIGVHDSSLDEFSPHKKRTMRRTRAASVMCDRAINPSSLSPAGSDITGHHLRSRRNINYMTPPLEDDSLHEKPDLLLGEQHEQENKDSTDLRATTRSLSKLASLPDIPQDEVWNSGRPKRACISKKRLSIDDRLANFKTYYKVEVVTPKIKPNASKNQELTKRQQSQSPKREEEKDKALIVKFKKLRNSELIQLNNEAVNFLFPKKDDTSEEEEEVNCNTTASSANSSSNLEIEDCNSSTPKVKNEDETSMDSTGKKKKRRTHAEAFILDNQKYYKFETPGSRLRYQGSYLPMVLKSPDRSTKSEDNIKIEEPEEKKIKYDTKVKLENYIFAFEKVPSKTGWYNAFKRLDNAEQSYAFFSNYLWESFRLPYQMRTIQPLDRRTCISHYQDILSYLSNLPSESNSRVSSPEPSVSVSSVSMYDPQDEDSKLSASTTNSLCETEDKPAIHSQPAKGVEVRGGKKKLSTSASRSASTSPSSSGGKNPRKSPRQHASTLAILSGLINQRKKRKGKITEENLKNLSTIEEEKVQVEEQKILEPIPIPTPMTHALRCSTTSAVSPSKAKLTPKKAKPRIDYYSIAQQIDEELDNALDYPLENYEIDFTEDNAIDFSRSRTTLEDILGLYEEINSKEKEKSCRKFYNGPSGRKPGFRRKKLNKTGWPNKSKKVATKKEPKTGRADNSTKDSQSINNDSDEEEEEDEEDVEEEPIRTISNTVERPKRKNVKQKLNLKKNSASSRNENLKHRVNKRDKDKLLNKLPNSERLQPYVCVQKLDGKRLCKKFVTPKRTIKR